MIAAPEENPVRAIHTAVPGRIRFKIGALYHSDPVRRKIEQELRQRERILFVSANTLTGTVLIRYESGNGYNASSLTILLEQLLDDPAFAAAGSRSYTLRDLARGSPSASFRTRRAGIPGRREARIQVAGSEDQALESWHALSPEEVTGLLGTSLQGLSDHAVKHRFKRYGPNILPESVPRSGWSIFLDQFRSLPVALLGVAAGLSLLTGGLSDAVIILAVVGINACIGYATESQSEKTIFGLKNLIQPVTGVIRNGAPAAISAREVVPGDVLALRPGSYIAADARLIEADFLSVDESALTGESMPVTKRSATVDRNLPLADRTNMVYMGTLVTGGQGLAVVVASGRFTEMGRIQTLVGEAIAPETPLERRMRTMGNRMVVISGAVCGVVFTIGLLRGYGFLEMLKSSIALAVSAVPEGLPTVATTTLALGIRRMRRLNVLIRHLEAVETLGSVQTVCLDKTGTVTMNRMSVVSVFAGMQSFRISEGSVLLKGKRTNPYESADFLRVVDLSVLCNESSVSGIDGEYTVQGSSTENAMLHLALQFGIDVNVLRTRQPLLKLNHRSSRRHFMSTVHQNGDHYLLAMKGSPSDVLSLCRWYIEDGKKLPLDDGARALLEAENERMACSALRVLAVAFAYGPGMMQSEDDVPEGLVWAGLVGMRDVVRSGAKNLIETFHRAGIDTVMITGDQGPTAYAVGRELDLSRGAKLEVVDSSSIGQPDSFPDGVHVFARVSPGNKLQIVQALQAAGKVVAMTGDGINDSPALKAADVGIAMGHAGTDVAREVADVVLEDDELETLVVAISQGRTVYNNIRKSVRFLLSTNMSEIMVMLTAIGTGMGRPLNVMQLLWVNLISDIFPGLALALEPPEPDVLTQPPRSPDEEIVRPGDFKRMLFESAAISGGSLAAYGYGALRHGQAATAGSMAFMSLCTGQLLHAFSCRSERHSIFDAESLPRNSTLDAAVAGSLGLQAMAALIPAIRSFLGLAPLDLFDAAVAAAAGVMPFVVNEATKKTKGPEKIAEPTGMLQRAEAGGMIVAPPLMEGVRGG